MNKRGITPLLKNFLIVGGLILAVFFSMIIVYNIVNIIQEGKQAEDSLSLTILKNSVILTKDFATLDIKGDLKGEELTKIKFVLDDGTNKEEIILDATQINSKLQQTFQLSLGKIDSTKTFSISIYPLIKSFAQEKTLELADRITLSYKSGSLDVKQESIKLASCSDCGGIFGCTQTKCHTLNISSGKCYYLGGLTKECVSCNQVECTDYKTQSECVPNWCGLNCNWTDSGCKEISICGDGTCASDENCSYCPSDCGICPYCGDGSCNGNEIYATCAVDCEGCGDGVCNAGETCTSCVADCGICCGDGVCNSSIGESCSTCAVDCGGINCLRTTGENCSIGSECQSGFCYIDNDGDRYTHLTGIKTCRASSQLTGTDCCDSDANAHPGQLSYFAGPNNCGNFDYDCDGGGYQEVLSCASIGLCEGLSPKSICSGVSGYDAINCGVDFADCGEHTSVRYLCHLLTLKKDFGTGVCSDYFADAQYDCNFWRLTSIGIPLDNAPDDIVFTEPTISEMSGSTCKCR